MIPGNEERHDGALTITQFEREMLVSLAETLREMLTADPDMPGYACTVQEAERLVSECEAAGIIEPQG